MSSNTGYIMTLANSIIGVGILAMPFCFQKCGILLSILLLMLSNLVTRLSCYYILKTSIKARRKNIEFLASYIFGSSGKLMVELCVIGYLMGTCITYFVVVGDLGPQIMVKLFNFSHSDSLRTFTMIVVTIICIIPLCLLRNIESLSAICISSIIFYFCLVLKIFFESENKISTSYWYDGVYWWRPSGITQCLPIFSMALSCQLQIFEIYESLPNQTIEKMSHIVKYGTGICTLVYICVGFFGYVAFYDQPFSGNVLLSLSSSFASDIIQMGFVLSVAVSFPLVVFPCRASLYSLLYHRSHSETTHYIPEHRFKYITISMVLVALIVGIFIPSIELIIGLVGSTIGVAICIMFPASCFIKTNKKNSTEKLAAQFLLVFGFCIMILGTYANLGAIDEQQSGTNIPIDRLPDIHITQPTENIFITPADNAEKIVEMGPQKPIVTMFEKNGKLKGTKRKLSKPTVQQTETVREINLTEKNKDTILDSRIENDVPIVPPNNHESPPGPVPNAKPADEIKPNNVASQLAEPTTNKKSSDSAINKEAIQKEDREIEFEAKERRKTDDERTKEILDEVKNQLSKQNEENQKKVLERINEISEKVDNIAQMQRDEQTAQIKNEPERTQVQNDDQNNQVKPSNIDTNEKIKNLPPIPVAQLLVDRKSSSVPSQQAAPKVSVHPKMDQPITAKKVTEPINELPKKIEKTNEKNVGRDLLSDSKEFHTTQANI